MINGNWNALLNCLPPLTWLQLLSVDGRCHRKVRMLEVIRSRNSLGLFYTSFGRSIYYSILDTEWIGELVSVGLHTAKASATSLQLLIVGFLLVDARQWKQWYIISNIYDPRLCASTVVLKSLLLWCNLFSTLPVSSQHSLFSVRLSLCIEIPNAQRKMFNTLCDCRHRLKLNSCHAVGLKYTVYQKRRDQTHGSNSDKPQPIFIFFTDRYYRKFAIKWLLN